MSDPETIESVDEAPAIAGGDAPVQTVEAADDTPATGGDPATDPTPVDPAPADPTPAAPVPATSATGTKIEFPDSPTEGSTYTDDNGRVWNFENGAWRQVSSPDVERQLRLDRYDLLVVASADGTGNAMTGQVFTVDNTTAAAKVIKFTGLPAGRSMTLVVEVNGDTGAVSVDPSIKAPADLVVSKPAANTTNTMVFFYNGTVVKLLSVTPVPN